jgi:hypothetical protein
MATDNMAAKKTILFTRNDIAHLPKTMPRVQSSECINCNLRTEWRRFTAKTPRISRFVPGLAGAMPQQRGGGKSMKNRHNAH